MEATRIASTYKNSKSKYYRILGGIAEISATIKVLKNAGVMIPKTPHSTCLCTEDRGVWENGSGLPGAQSEGGSSSSYCSRCGFAA